MLGGITSELANQRAPKAQFTCVVYTKNLYYQVYFCTNLNNMKKTWEGINTLINKTRQTRTVTTFQLSNSQRITRNQSEIAKTLNNHFASVRPKLANSIPPPSRITLMLSPILKLKWKFWVLHQVKHVDYTLVQFVSWSPHATSYLLPSLSGT